MNKEEFLKKMREENEYNDPFENEISSFSWKIGAIVALALSLILYHLEWLLYGNYNIALFVAILSMLAIKFIIKAIRIKSVSYIVCSVMFSILLIVSLITYIIVFANGWL